MKRKTLTYSVVIAAATLQQAIACAPTGPVNHYISNDCPSILDWDFTTFSASSPYISSAGITSGTLVGSDTDFAGNNYTGVLQSNGHDPIKINFTPTFATDLHGVQLTNYFTKENGSPAWDDFGAKISVNGVQQGIVNPPSPWTTAFQGYKIGSDGYWDFTSSAANAAAPGLLSVNAGDLVELEFFNLRPDSTPNGDYLAIDDLSIHGCVVPEPSSALLSGLAGLMLLVRRRR